MEGEHRDAISAGRDAFLAGDWAGARDAFARALPSGEPRALDGYGQALWFLGEPEAGIEWRERACIAHAERGECDAAGRIAAWVAHQHVIAGRGSLARGWLARGERALATREDCAGAGWVAVERARLAPLAERLEGTARALAIARRAGDADLECFALSILGRSEVEAGRFDDGIAHLEEAMAGALAGRIANPHTLGETYCNMIAAATAAGDWERAAEWCELVQQHAERWSIAPLFAACRTTHADVLLASGQLDVAEDALVQAIAAFERHSLDQASPALATLAQLRVHQGRLAEAEALLEGREEERATLLALALLRLAEGEPAVAAGLLERGLATAGGDVLSAARLLVLLVDARLGEGDEAAAADALGRLADVAARSGRPLAAASAALAAARVARAAGRADDAQASAGAALRAFGRLGMPREVAEARLELARALAATNGGLALDEARAARAAFRQLGAARSADAAGALLRELGAGTPAGPRGDGVDLTAREREVLGLVACGLTNAEIGERLFISPKTAGHHVSRILGKLGTPNRAAAAARARTVLDRE